MDLADALDVVTGRTRHDRYRWLCSDENPGVLSRESYRELVLRLASGPPPETDAARAARLTAEYPPGPANAPRRCCE
jgi:hypothetical protein